MLSVSLEIFKILVKKVSRQWKNLKPPPPKGGMKGTLMTSGMVRNDSSNFDLPCTYFKFVICFYIFVDSSGKKHLPIYVKEEAITVLFKGRILFFNLSLGERGGDYYREAIIQGEAINAGFTVWEN